jgi:hypothetical protein
MLMQDLDYNLLFRWFVGLTIWYVTVYTKDASGCSMGTLVKPSSRPCSDRHTGAV